MTTKTDITLPHEFRSANDIPVERATIKRERMIEIIAEAVEADRQNHIADVRKMVPSDEELIKWGGEEEFFLFCSQDEFLDIVKSALSRYGGGQPAIFGQAETRMNAGFAARNGGDLGQPAASAEPRPDEYDYFVDWYDKEAPDENEVRNFDMARHAWLAGVRFADLFPAAAPVAQEPVAYRLMRKNADGEWVTDGRPWCDGVPDADLVKDSEKSGQYRIEYAFAAPQPAEPVKCLDPSMGEHACSNRAQCWEPCGELGSSVDHAKVAEPVKVPSDDLRTLQNLLSWAEAQICLHEETHRGGAIWEICDQCGAKWADDEGGRPEFQWPEPIVKARALLSRYGDSQPAASAGPSGYAYRYPDGIRFNDGRAVNGCKPTETLPYWFGAAPVAQEPVRYLIQGKASHDEYVEDLHQAHRRKEQRMDAFSGEDETEIIPLYATPVTAQAQPVVNQSLTTEREAFEAAFCAQTGICIPKNGPFTSGRDGALHEVAWWAWQARAAIDAARAAKERA